MLVELAAQIEQNFSRNILGKILPGILDGSPDDYEQEKCNPKHQHEMLNLLLYGQAVIQHKIIYYILKQEREQGRNSEFQNPDQHSNYNPFRIRFYKHKISFPLIQ
ncbi:hypothetical protein D3C81_927870 [compost metagenome]